MPEENVDPALLGGDNPEEKQGEDHLGDPEPGKGLSDRDWYKSLDESSQKRLSKFAEEGAIAKSYLALEEKLGGSIVPPKPDATADEWAKFFAKLPGRPEKPEDYALPEGKFHPEVEKVIREKLLAGGIIKNQAGTVLEVITEATKRAQELKAAEREALATQSVELLKQELGAEFETSLAKAKEAADAIFPEALAKRLQADGYGRDAAFVKTMLEFSKKMGETKLVIGKPAGGADKKDPYDYLYRRYKP